MLRTMLLEKRGRDWSSLLPSVMLYMNSIVSQAGFGSHINWIYDPAPPPLRRATLHSRDSHVSIPSDKRKNLAPAIATHCSREAPLTPSLPQKHRKRRRRNAQRAANRNSAASSQIPVTPDERWANQRAAVPAGAREQRPHISQADGSVPAFPDCR